MEFNFTKGKDDSDKVLAKLNFLKDGETYTVSIAKAKSKRSIAQNKLLWMWLRCIADNTGNSPQVLHDFYCNEFLKCAVFMDYKGEQKTILKVLGTSELNQNDMTTFLKNVQSHAASELGIVLPVPADDNWQYFQEQYNY